MTRWIFIGLAALLAVGGACAQVETDLPRAAGVVPAIVMGTGEHAVIALHGGELAANCALAHADGTLDTIIQFASSDDHGLPMLLTKKLFAFNKHGA